MLLQESEPYIVLGPLLPRSVSDLSLSVNRRSAGTPGLYIAAMTRFVAGSDEMVALGKQLLPGRFEAVADPLGWRCLGCGVTVRSEQSTADVARLAESAADHGLQCGRCDD